MFFAERNKRLVANVNRLKEIENNVINFNAENKELIKIIEEREKAIQKIISEKSKGFPWLTEAIAEFYQYQDEEIAKYLSRKSHPAYAAAESVKAISQKNRILRKQLKIAQNFVTYYETLFPWITEYVGDNLDELLESIINTKEEGNEEFDPVLNYMPRAEYEKLPSYERNQKALDRYLASRKRSYEIGRDYERYIGYVYEKAGYKVEYIGIEEGLEDMGRDLVCLKDEVVEIVQCKCWASHKIIHEKHINQLYGTVVKYYIDHENITNRAGKLTLFPDLIKSKKIKASFITSTKLSDTAKKFAKALGVEIVEEAPLVRYSIIKCNISSKGEKIYHLPFDQQYDRTFIRNQGEFYAMTVKEAEDKGFRRAFRWRGTNSNQNN